MVASDDVTSRTAGSLSLLLTRATRMVTERVAEVLRREGLSLDQWLVVEALAERRGLTMAEIAATTMATGPTLTRIVDHLVLTAVAYREVDPDDRRRVRVYLSTRGRATHRRIAGKVRAVEDDILAMAVVGEDVRATLDRLGRAL